MIPWDEDEETPETEDDGSWDDENINSDDWENDQEEDEQ